MVIIGRIRSQLLANVNSVIFSMPISTINGRLSIQTYLQSNKRNILRNNNIGIQFCPISTSVINNAQVN